MFIKGPVFLWLKEKRRYLGLLCDIYASGLLAFQISGGLHFFFFYLTFTQGRKRCHIKKQFFLCFVLRIDFLSFVSVF